MWKMMSGLWNFRSRLNCKLSKNFILGNEKDKNSKKLSNQQYFPTCNKLLANKFLDNFKQIPSTEEIGWKNERTKKLAA